MSIYVEVSAVIEKPVAEVFRIHAAEHVENHPRWDPKMQLEQITDGPFGVGTILKRINSRSGEPVEGTMEVIEYELNESFGMIIKDGPNEMRGRTLYESKGANQTVMTHQIEFFGIDKTADKNILTNLMETAINNHKRYIEDEA